MASSGSGVPPGFRFHPTDEEQLHYYLRKKVSFQKFDIEVIRFERDGTLGVAREMYDRFNAAKRVVRERTGQQQQMQGFGRQHVEISAFETATRKLA